MRYGQAPTELQAHDSLPSVVYALELISDGALDVDVAAGEAVLVELAAARTAQEIRQLLDAAGGSSPSITAAQWDAALDSAAASVPPDWQAWLAQRSDAMRGRAAELLLVSEALAGIDPAASTPPADSQAALALRYARWSAVDLDTLAANARLVSSAWDTGELLSLAALVEAVTAVAGLETAADEELAAVAAALLFGGDTAAQTVDALLRAGTLPPPEQAATPFADALTALPPLVAGAPPSDADATAFGFYLCPSCSQKRTLLFAEHLTEEVLLNLPHRQFVFALPKALRIFFRHDRRLFGRVLFHTTYSDYFKRWECQRQKSCTSSTLWTSLPSSPGISHRRGCNSFVAMVCTPRASRVTGPACPTFYSGRHQVGRAIMMTRPPPHPTGPRAELARQLLRCSQRKPTLQTRVHAGMRGPAGASGC